MSASGMRYLVFSVVACVLLAWGFVSGVSVATPAGSNAGSVGSTANQLATLQGLTGMTAVPGLLPVVPFTPQQLMNAFFTGDVSMLRMWMMYRNMLMMSQYGAWGWGDDGYDIFDD